MQFSAVGRGKHSRVPSSRTLFRGLPPGHICERGDAEGVLDRRADEVQERLQIQNCVRGAADGDGAAAGLRQWRMGPHQSHQIIRAHTHHSSGRSINRFAYIINLEQMQDRYQRRRHRVAWRYVQISRL